MFRHTKLTKANIGDNYGIFGRNQSETARTRNKILN